MLAFLLALELLFHIEGYATILLNGPVQDFNMLSFIFHLGSDLIANVIVL